MSGKTTWYLFLASISAVGVAVGGTYALRFNACLFALWLTCAICSELAALRSRIATTDSPTEAKP